MIYKTLSEVNKALKSLLINTYARQNVYTLDRIQGLMELLGNPQDQYKTVHIAGTSGKSSTAYYTAALLRATGASTGLTTSPHVAEINERVQINMLPLPEVIFCRYFSEFMNIPGLHEIEPTYFELLVAFAFWVFAKEGVDYAVVEVGLGGLLDGTNVISRSDKVCVITDIGLDHTTVLGDSIEKIALQKAGIIRRGNQAFMMEQDDKVVAVVRSVSGKYDANLTIVKPSLTTINFLKDLPPFQQRNWQLAETVYNFIQKRDKLPKLNDKHLERTAHISIPARMEVLKVGYKMVVLDGSHNQQKLHALREGLAQQFASKQISAVISFGKAREGQIVEALREIIPCVDYLIATSFNTSQDAHHISVDPKKIVAACQELGFKNTEVEHNPRTAFKKLLRRPEPVILVTGSFYLLNHIRPLVKGVV